MGSNGPVPLIATAAGPATATEDDVVVFVTGFAVCFCLFPCMCRERGSFALGDFDPCAVQCRAVQPCHVSSHILSCYLQTTNQLSAD
jgi:hypothetical protein